jgi:hypothetical protein
MLMIKFLATVPMSCRTTIRHLLRKGFRVKPGMTRPNTLRIFAPLREIKNAE